MAKKLKGDQVFTGQLLLSGDVVFMASDGSWGPDIRSAAIAKTDEEIEQLERLVVSGISSNLVVDVYPIVVIQNQNGNLVPEHIREKIRHAGPSVAYC